MSILFFCESAVYLWTGRKARARMFGQLVRQYEEWLQASVVRETGFLRICFQEAERRLSKILKRKQRKGRSLFVQVDAFCYTLQLIKRRFLDRGGANRDGVGSESLCEGPCPESIHREVN